MRFVTAFCFMPDYWAGSDRNGAIGNWAVFETPLNPAAFDFCKWRYAICQGIAGKP